MGRMRRAKGQRKKERRYPLRNPSKYIGDPNNVIARSTWEWSTFIYLDRSNHVARWNSEELVIPYICHTDNRQHMYHIDLIVEYTDGRVVIVEIKPDHETRPPVKKYKNGKEKKQQTYLKETMTYAKNCAKWEAAKSYADKNNVTFEIWTEHKLKAMGVKLYRG